VIAKDFVDPVLEVLAANGVPLVSRSPKSDNAYSSAALLDGFVIHVHTHGFPAGQLSSGWRPRDDCTDRSSGSERNLPKKIGLFCLLEKSWQAGS
jgi:hypothetical protein